MKLTAKDVMVKEFDTIQRSEPIENALKRILKGKLRATGYKTVSIMVTDEFGHLAGVLSMFDVLYHLRPPFLNYMGDNINFGEQELLSYIKRFKGLTVGQVMNSPVLYVTSDTDLMIVIDRMVKEKCRRLPVLEDDKVVGIVYLPEVYCHLCKEWLDMNID